MQDETNFSHKLSLLKCLKCYTTYEYILRGFVFEIHVTVLWSNILHSIVIVTTHTARCLVYSRHIAQQGSGVIIEYTHEEYCDMPLPSVPLTSRAGVAAREYALR
jgi:hypothetical protein